MSSSSSGGHGGAVGAGGSAGTGAIDSTGTSGSMTPDAAGNCSCRAAGESDEQGTLTGLAALCFAVAARSRRRHGRAAT